MTDLASHLSLLVSAFLSATLLPGFSEVLLAGLVLLNPASPASLFAVATIGNTAGSLVNWYLGRSLVHFADRRWFPVSTQRINEASALFHRYGSWALLFSWLPIVGDALTVTAGALQIRLMLFLPLVAIGKATRYLFVVAEVELVRTTAPLGAS